MKIKGMIFLARMAVMGFVLILVLHSPSLAQTPKSFSKALEHPIHQELNQLSKTLKEIKDQIVEPEPRWSELENFHQALFHAMALDPSPGMNVSPAEVPKELWANALNADLETKFEKIRTSENIEKFKIQHEFEAYAALSKEILDLRKARQFPQSRAIAKKGFLDDRYQEIWKAIRANGQANPESKWVKDLMGAETSIANIRAKVDQEFVLKNPFLSGGRFLIYALIAIFGAFVGAWVMRYFDRKQKTTNQDPIQIHFNYSNWLQEFEVELSHLKKIQQSQERRMEEIVGQCERISRQALALYSDARVQADANVESKMNALLREIHQVFEESKKLQATDRIPIQQALSHALKLCDVIEELRPHLVERDEHQILPAQESPADQAA